ncbi:MAG: peptidylprolyl isomerase [Gammaproteobacteria bacterium]|jgi:peptidyl-prolyl cis-trans isomerase SurA
MNLSLRSIVFLACLFWAALAGAQSGAAPRALDRVVAVVNSDVVTASELASRVRSVERQLRRQRIQAPPGDVLEKQVLERLVMDRALVQMAREQGLRVDDAQLERAVAGIASENGLSASQLRAQIEADGVSFARFREDLREELLVARLREREVDARIQISEADIDAFLAEQRDASGAQPEYELAQVLLRVPEGASAAEIERQRLRGEEVIRQARAGGDFARLAAAFSDAPDAMSGGALGPRTADRLPELFAKAAGSMQPGEVSGLLRSPNGFHVLKLIARRDAGAAKLEGGPVTQTRARHILIRPSELVSEPEVLRRLGEIRSRLQAGGADFAELARQYSVDGSAGRGGDLGWIYPGDTVPDFERAMNALQPGQLSEPVRTEFGYHLIQVLERRTDAASPERVRALARQALRERRIEETLQDWLRQVRDRTYVEYRDR